MTSHFPDHVMSALKDALVNVFWTKRHLRESFQRCDVPSLSPERVRAQLREQCGGGGEPLAHD